MRGISSLPSCSLDHHWFLFVSYTWSWVSFIVWALHLCCNVIILLFYFLFIPLMFAFLVPRQNSLYSWLLFFHYFHFFFFLDRLFFSILLIYFVFSSFVFLFFRVLGIFVLVFSFLFFLLDQFLWVYSLDSVVATTCASIIFVLKVSIVSISIPLISRFSPVSSILYSFSFLATFGC